MTNEELNRRSAELLGWVRKPTRTGFPRYFYEKDGEPVYLDAWHPYDDPAQADMLVAEIKKHGLSLEYSIHLLEGMGFEAEYWDGKYVPAYYIWLGVSATPEQKTAAFVATMEAR